MNEYGIIEIKKEKAIATFTCCSERDETTHSLIIDFSVGEMFFDGNKVENQRDFLRSNRIFVKHTIANVTPNFSRCVRAMLTNYSFNVVGEDGRIIDWHNYSSSERLKFIEKYWNYFDLISMLEPVPPVIDNNYAIWVKNKEYNFCNETYKFYKKIQRIKQESSGNDAKRFENLADSIGLHRTIELIDNEKLKKVIFSSINISNKYYEKWNLELSDMMIIAEQYDISLADFIDATKGIRDNHKTLTAYKEKRDNEKIADKLCELSFLDGFEYDKYCVVVPTCVEDLINEGKQQHNCVGSYYNSDIAEGDDYIYFIRLKENKEQSYITCRYHVYSEETVEVRKKNNQDDFGEEGTIIGKMLEQIDSKIYEVLF